MHGIEGCRRWEAAWETEPKRWRERLWIAFGEHNTFYTLKRPKIRYKQDHTNKYSEQHTELFLPIGLDLCCESLPHSQQYRHESPIRWSYKCSDDAAISCVCVCVSAYVCPILLKFIETLLSTLTSFPVSIPFILFYFFFISQHPHPFAVNSYANNSWGSWHNLVVAVFFFCYLQSLPISFRCFLCAVSVFRRLGLCLWHRIDESGER